MGAQSMECLLLDFFQCFSNQNLRLRSKQKQGINLWTCCAEPLFQPLGVKYIAWLPTPPHIVPEWYFLPIHVILRSIPDKSGGVAVIAPIFISLLAFPFFKSMYVHSSSFRPIHQGIFWLLLAYCLLLGWIRCQPVEAPFVTIGQIPSLFFFLFFAITPFLGRVGRGIQNSYTDETNQT